MTPSFAGHSAGVCPPKEVSRHQDCLQRGAEVVRDDGHEILPCTPLLVGEILLGSRALSLLLHARVQMADEGTEP